MTSTGNPRPGAFIDRDGVINEERAYVHRVEDFVLLPNAIAGLRALADAGFALVVVTNQAGVAHGYYDEAAVRTLHEHLQDVLAHEGLHLDAIRYCPHHPLGATPAYRQACECRKPAPGMVLDAARALGLDLAASVMIGDKLSDVQAGRAAGVGLNILVRSGHALRDGDAQQADAVCDDLLDAARCIATRSNIGS